MSRDGPLEMTPMAPQARMAAVMLPPDRPTLSAISAEKVWRVITDREMLKQWFPCEVVGNWTVGAKLEFIFPPEQAEGIPDEDLHGEVLAVDEPRLLELRWDATTNRRNSFSRPIYSAEPDFVRNRSRLLANSCLSR